MFSRWIRLSGVSRGTRISFRPSLSATSAARWIRFDADPEATAVRVRIEQGAITMPSVLNEPDATTAPMSSLSWTVTPGRLSTLRFRLVSIFMTFSPDRDRMA